MRQKAERKPDGLKMINHYGQYLFHMISNKGISAGYIHEILGSAVWAILTSAFAEGGTAISVLRICVLDSRFQTLGFGEQLSTYDHT